MTTVKEILKSIEPINYFTVFTNKNSHNVGCISEVFEFMVENRDSGFGVHLAAVTKEKGTMVILSCSNEKDLIELLEYLFIDNNFFWWKGWSSDWKSIVPFLSKEFGFFKLAQFISEKSYFKNLTFDGFEVERKRYVVNLEEGLDIDLTPMVEKAMEAALKEEKIHGKKR